MFKFFFILLSFFYCSLVQANSYEFEVEKITLKNGLRVLLYEDNRLPIYSLHLWYNVGSSNEDPKRTGLAHFFEHLMFKGTKKFKEGVFDNLIEENGGRNNAFTTRDYTGYYVDMPSGTLKTVLKLEADRMKNLSISLDKVKREREVVKEERRLRVDNSPFGAGLEKLFEKSYTKKNPYRWSVIGSMKHLESASIEDFKNFYKKFYSPNNAVLVIAGKFKSAKAKRWIKKYFSSLVAQDLKKDFKKKQGFSRGTSTKLKKNVMSKTLLMSFPGVSVLEKDAKILDLVSLILTSGKISRLYRRLVEKEKLLVSTDSWNFTPKAKGLIMFFQSLRPGVSSYKVKRIFKEEILKLVKNGITEKELLSVKKKTKIGSLKSFKTLSGKAQGLAQNEIVYGNYKKLFTDIKDYEEISAQSINKVLKKYFNFKNLTTVEVGK